MGIEIETTFVEPDIAVIRNRFVALKGMYYVVTQTEISTVSPGFHGEIPDLLAEHRLPRGAN